MAAYAQHFRVRAHTPARAWKLSVPALVIALIGLSGVGIFLYPTVADWVAQFKQSEMIVDYTNTVADGVDPSAQEQLAAARAYNEALVSGTMLKSGERKATSEIQEQGDYIYTDMLSADVTGMMARLQIPSIKLDLPVFHGTDDDTLLQGLGHLEGSSLPVGGTSTHSVITGHRGLAEATMFTYLDRVKVGDTFTINVL